MDRGTDFLKSQINNAVMQHQTFLKNLEDHERQAEDTRYRDLCSRFIPHVREHQRMLEEYQQAIGAEAEVMFRLVGPVEPVKEQLSRWAAGHAELEWGSFIPAQHFHTIDGFDVAPVAYTSDIPLLSRWGTPLLLGPGSIHVAHTPDEFIAVDELRASVDAYERIVRALLA